MKILAIESSCDETAAAVVERTQDSKLKVHSNVVASQIELHAQTGGVVPERAAREHLNVILPVVDQALEQAHCSWDEIDAIAVTEKPGLIGSLLIGRMTAASLAYIHKKPLIPTDHILGHVFATWLEVEELPQFPVLSLTVSGGHNELVLIRSAGEVEQLGESVDDAAGEAFDKVARLLGLPYPGGPQIERLASQGNPKAISFPRAKMEGFDFSFSGLKTSVLYHVQAHPEDLSDPKKLADLAASFQEAIFDQFLKQLMKAVKQFQPKEVHLTGGVSANKMLRHRIETELTQKAPGTRFRTPLKMSYCTDNAAMIGAAALMQG